MSFPTGDKSKKNEKNETSDKLKDLSDKAKSLTRNRSEFVLPPIKDSKTIDETENINMNFDLLEKFKHTKMRKEILKNRRSKSQTIDVDLSHDAGSPGGFNSPGGYNSPRSDSSGKNSPNNHNEKSEKKLNKRNAKSTSDFLNAITINRKEIINHNVKKLLDEVNGFGPRCPHCDSCNNLNIDYYNEMVPLKACDFLHYIKHKRIKLTNFGPPPKFD